MSVIEYQSGIVPSHPDSRPLYIVHLSCFDDWLTACQKRDKLGARNCHARQGRKLYHPADIAWTTGAAALLIDKKYYLGGCWRRQTATFRQAGYLN